MKVLYIAFSLVTATFTNAQVIGQNVNVTSTCYPPPQNSTDIILCNELIGCLEIITGTPFNYCGADKEDVCNVLLSYGQKSAKEVKAICDITPFFLPTPTAAPTASSFPTASPEGGYPTGTYSNGTEQVQAQQACLLKATVTVPDDSGVNTAYDSAVDSIVNTFLKGDKRGRSNDDEVAKFLIPYWTAAEVLAGFEACDSDVLIILSAGGCLAAKTAKALALQAMEIVRDQLSYHDGAIDSSEIAATLENTESILDQTCSVSQKLDQANQKLDQANLKLDEAILKLDQANEKLDQANRKLDQANEKLDDLLCPFGPNGATFTALRQGCDAIDQDCNKVVDECSEDKVPPSLTLRTSIPDKPFKSIEDARQFLQENVVESDDCAVEFSTQIVLQSEPNCCDCTFQVNTADVRCVNDNAPGSATASRNFVVKVDSTAPVINCGFFVQQDAFHVSGGFDVCAGLTVPFPGDNDPLHIDKNTIGEGLFNVGLWYQVDEDECDKGVIPVTIRVLSNELAKEENVWIVERNDLPNVVHRAEVYVSPNSCHDDDYLGRGSICEIDETRDDTVSTRFYDIAISATDAAGNTGTKVCSVIVIPDDHYATSGKSGKSSGIGQHASPDDLREEYRLSTKRYVISELSLQWDPNLDTTLVIPPLQDPIIGSKSGKSSKSVLCNPTKTAKSMANPTENLIRM